MDFTLKQSRQLFPPETCFPVQCWSTSCLDAWCSPWECWTLHTWSILNENNTDSCPRQGLQPDKLLLRAVCKRKSGPRHPPRVYFKRGGTPWPNESSAKTRNVGSLKYTLHPPLPRIAIFGFWLINDVVKIDRVFSPDTPGCKIGPLHAVQVFHEPGQMNPGYIRKELVPKRYFHTGKRGRQMCDLGRLAWHWKPSEILRTNHIHHGDANLITELVGVITISTKQ